MQESRFPESFKLRTPVGFTAALALVADRHCTTVSEYSRQALLRALAADGVRLRNGKPQAEDIS